MPCRGLKPGFLTGKTALERTALLFWMSQHWQEQGDSGFSVGWQQHDSHTTADSACPDFAWQHCATLSEQPHPSHWQTTGGASAPSNRTPIVIQATHCRNVFCRIVMDSFTLLCNRQGFYITPAHCLLYRTNSAESTTFWEKNKNFEQKETASRAGYTVSCLLRKQGIECVLPCLRGGHR